MIASLIIVLVSVWNVFHQTLIYPWMVNKLDTPIPYLASVGMVFVAAGYVLVTMFTSVGGQLFAVWIMFLGVCSANPTAVTIISVGSHRHSSCLYNHSSQRVGHSSLLEQLRHPGFADLLSSDSGCHLQLEQGHDFLFVLHNVSYWPFGGDLLVL